MTVEDKARKLHYDTIQQSPLPSLEQPWRRSDLQLQHTAYLPRAILVQLLLASKLLELTPLSCQPRRPAERLRL